MSSSVLENLTELRKQLLKSFVVFAITTAISLLISQFLFEIIIHPFKQSFSSSILIGTSPAEAFLVRLKISLLAGFILGLPYFLFGLYQFIVPGLYKNEQKLLKPFIWLSSIGFLLGVIFGYFIALPSALIFFASEFTALGLNANIKIDQYINFVILLLLIFGLVYELPLLAFFLGKLNLLTSSWLISRCRGIIVSIFILAAILTPPDVISQLLLAIPLLFIYLLSIGIIKLLETRKKLS